MKITVDKDEQPLSVWFSTALNFGYHGRGLAPNEAAAQEFRVKKSEMAIATPEVMSTLDMFFVHEQKMSLESL